MCVEMMYVCMYIHAHMCCCFSFNFPGNRGISNGPSYGGPNGGMNRSTVSNRMGGGPPPPPTKAPRPKTYPSKKAAEKKGMVYSHQATAWLALLCTVDKRYCLVLLAD